MANKSIIISTPRGQIIQNTTKGGKVTAKLDWNNNFGAQQTDKFSRAQKFVDSEILRLDAPYMPIKTGTLIKSGQLGTEIGSGEVNYIAPYAAAQYYDTSQSRSYDAQRGGNWFERMKVDHKDEIVAGAKKLAGGG